MFARTGWRCIALSQARCPVPPIVRSKTRFRPGEDQIHPLNSVRIYRENDAWYFDIREGTAPGLFRDQTRAKQALAVFLADACGTPPNPPAKLSF